MKMENDVYIGISKYTENKYKNLPSEYFLCWDKQKNKNLLHFNIKHSKLWRELLIHFLFF